MSYGFAADGRPSNVDGYKYYGKQKSIREDGVLKWSAEDSGRNLEAELDKLCVREVAAVLVKLKGWVRDTTRMRRELHIQKDDLKNIVVAGIRSGELSRAPLNLDQNNKNTISAVPPEGTGRLLCNLYATRKSNEVV